MKKHLFAAIGIAASLVACGGGGDAGGTTPPATTPATTPAPNKATMGAAGLWGGLTSNQRIIGGLIMDDGTYYFIYASQSGDDFGGVVQGKGVLTGSNFLSTDGVDFNFEGAGVRPAQIQATAVPKQSLDGRITYLDGSSVSYSTTYHAAFEQTPSLASVAGSFEGAVVGGTNFQTINFSISPQGDLTGQSIGGCIATGTLKPRLDGNAYDLSINFGQACPFAGQVLAGIAAYNSTSRTLVAGVMNAARNNGVLFSGTKP